MRKGYLLWFFTLLCSQLFLCSLSLDEVPTLQNKDPKIKKLPPVAQEKQGTYSSGNFSLHTYGGAKDHTTDTEMAQRGRGTYGGANVVHRRPGEKAAASVLESPFGLFLLLILPHLVA
ncbi:uncharacterized protein LOC113768559 [Coffea eugenioides]|uniref:uncharacterized protein LOC113768559 n=1 Tax=Coffea eugenioides TaxID=49369 RepID=UPI000F5CC030|nr:uncharacterized protein LOC113739651 [Coffea arabica]XP_027125826.1 uncharacterized protein LOC113742234 [Coffea arabica]XP_027168767.1 uncharacterized protein LOC113768559 [Coffea eugenioides]